MGRMEQCGAAIVLPTYPAWSFGAKHPLDPLAPGPGPGMYGSNGTLNHIGPKHGPPRPPKQKPPKEPWVPPPKQEFYVIPRLPLPIPVEKVAPAKPGPTDYDTFKGMKLIEPRVKSSSWGPPPAVYKPAPPPPLPPVTPPAKFKKPPPPRRPADPIPHDPTPGPADYCPYGACKCGCCAYKGWTFGHRVPGRPKTAYPGPGQYHVACTTLGAAAQGCEGAAGGGHHHHHSL